MKINKYLNVFYLRKSSIHQLKKLYYCYNWPIRPKSSLYIFQTIQDFIINQFIQNEFNRLDIIVRLLAIEQFYKQNEIGFELYKKMQLKRVGKDTLDSFQSLILNVERLGMDVDQPIDLDADLQLRNGAHRIAYALFLQNSHISVKVNRKSRNIQYNKNWFMKNEFNNSEMDQINHRLKVLVEQNKIYFKAIIWPDAINHKEVIIEKVKKSYDIYNVKEILFSENKLYDFIRDVYLIDDIHDDRIEVKINNFKKYFKKQNDFKICLIDFLIPNPDFRIKHPTKHKISTKVELIKKDIRKMIKPSIENYFHDNIIHIGDNYYHTEFIEKCIIEYGRRQNINI
jgi:hypothetical protein